VVRILSGAPVSNNFIARMLPQKARRIWKQKTNDAEKADRSPRRIQIRGPVKSWRQGTKPIKSIRRTRSTEKAFSSIGSWIWMAVTVLSTIGGLTAYFVFWPRLDISEGPHPREKNPIAIPFAVSNNGILPIYPQELVCWVYDLESENGNLRDVAVGTADSSPVDSAPSFSDQTKFLGNFETDFILHGMTTGV